MRNNNIGRRINSIDIVRLFCALLVVSEHTMPFKDFNPAVWNAFYKICVLAVPYFFIVSGFFISRSNNKIMILKQYVKYYLVWSAVYDIWLLIDWALLGAQYSKVDFGTFIKYRIIEFLSLGSFYHMWFLWSLIFLTILTIVCEKIRLEKFLLLLMIACFVIGLALVPYYNVIIAPNAVVNKFVKNLLDQWWFDSFSNVLIRAIPYFYLGYWLEKWKMAEKYKVKNWHLIGLFLLYVAEQFIMAKYGTQRAVVLTFFMFILVGVIVLWLVQHPIYKYNELGDFSKESANYVYFVHALVIEVLIRVFGTDKMTIHFVWAIIICMVLAILKYKIQERKYIRVKDY